MNWDEVIPVLLDNLLLAVVIKIQSYSRFMSFANDVKVKHEQRA